MKHPPRAVTALLRILGRTRWKAGISLVVGTTLCAACGPSHSSSPSLKNLSRSRSVTVSLNVIPGTLYTRLVYLAQQEGFFAKNGVNARLIAVTGGPQAFAALVGGSIQFAAGAMINAGSLVDQGTPLEIVSGMWDDNQNVLIAAKSTHLPSQFPAGVKGLTGKPVGVVSPGSAFYYYARMILQAAGVNPASEEYVSTTVIPANIVAALGSGRVPAAMVPLGTAYGLAAVEGDTVLFDQDTSTASLFPGTVPTPAELPQGAPLRQLSDTVVGYLWASKPWAQSHSDAVHRVQLALMETDVWLHNPANREKATATLIDNHEVTVFPGESIAQLKHLLATTVPLLTSYVPKSQVALWQRVLVSIGALHKSVPVSQFYDAQTPGSAAQVVARVKAAIGGALGSSA